jgi:outer membrane protein assembly factor BamB
MIMRKERLGLVLFLTFYWAVASVAPAPAANWPRFRGPNGSGIAQDQHIPVQWDKQTVLWKAVLPGVGNSSPVVWGDRLFLQAASPDGTERFLFCLNTADGKVVWSRSVPAARAPTNARNSLASSTPATDGERVYVVFWDGKEVGLYAYNFQGDFLWKHGLGGFKSQHGAGASPMVFEDKVILANDQDGASVLVCLDGKTGKTVWEAPRKPFRACYSTPLVLEKPGEAPELIVTSTAGVTGYNPRTGGVNWHWTWAFDKKPLRTVSSSVYADGVLFANSGDGDGSRHAAAVQLDGHGPDTRTRLLWEEKRTLPYVPGMLVRGEYLYWVNDLGFAGCTVARTGKTVFYERLAAGSVTASPVLIDGKVYAVDESGTVHVFAAEPHFKLLARNKLGERVIASPAVADGRLYVRGQTHLFCIGEAREK